MVSALLALQQAAGVLQVTGQPVALPLQLLCRLLGCLVRTPQLPELWEEQNESPGSLGAAALMGREQALEAEALSQPLSLSTCHLSLSLPRGRMG